MILHKHKDYKEYYDAQVEKNVRKIGLVWIKPRELEAIAKHININIESPVLGICHGVRNGWEVQQFAEYTKAKVIGTDISPTVKEFDNCIQWDFHDVKDEWIDNVDFIYSNSFDHSHSPGVCLDTWMSCLKPNGICYIHHGDYTHEGETGDQADCFNLSTNEMRKFLSSKYRIKDEFYPMDNKRIIFALKKYMRDNK